MPPENPPPPSPPEEKRLITPSEQTPLSSGEKEPLATGEKPEAAAERLTTQYFAKGQTEVDHGEQAVAKAVENGKKEGLKIS